MNAISNPLTCCSTPVVGLDGTDPPQRVRCQVCGTTYMPFDFDYSETERRAVSIAMMLGDGVMKRAAELLKVTRHRLRRKLEKYEIAGYMKRTGEKDDAAAQ